MIRSLRHGLLIGFAAALSSTAALSQTSSVALGEARVRLACGTGTVVSAQYLPGGTIKVTCRGNSLGNADSVLGGTGLNPAFPGLAPITTAIVVGVIAGGSGGTTTTTTTGDN